MDDNFAVPNFIIAGLICVNCGDKMIISFGAKHMKCRCGTFPVFMAEFKQEMQRG